MKVKSICPLLAIAAAILAFALAFAACPGDDGPGKKTVAGIEITKLPDTTGYIAGEGLELDITGLEITVLYSDGSTIKITGGDLAGVTVSGFDPETEGPQTITVSYGGKSAVFTVTVTVMVTAAPSYAISASALKPFGALVTPYAQPEAQTVTVTNTGTGAVMLAQPSAEYYEIGELSALTLAANGDTASFTVRPKTGLAEGEYDESIDVYGMGGEGAPVNAAVSAAFIVTAAPTYDISASALIPFGSLQTPYTQPAAQTVTVTSTGSGAVTLTQPVAVNFEIGELSPLTLAAYGATATFTVRPKAALAVDTYDEDIVISGSDGASATVNAAFTVSATPTYAISASVLAPFGSLSEGYTPPEAQTITVTNTGDQPVTLTQPAAAYYDIGALSAETLAANGDKATFTVRPKAALAAAVYNEDIAISGSGGASAAVNAAFTVTAALTYSVSVSPQELSFGLLAQGYSQPAAQTVTVTNTGTGAVTLTQPEAENYALGSISPKTLAAGAKAAFTVRPEAGLAAGEYNRYITVSGSNGASEIVAASFEVTELLTKTVTIGEQLGAVISGMESSAIFIARTANIEGGKTGTVAWYAALTSATPLASSPVAGITVSVTNVIDNTATVVLNGATTAAAADYYFKVTIDGVTSDMATLTVGPAPAKTVTVDTQYGTIGAGAGGSAVFAVTTANIANGQTGSVTWYTTSAGTSATTAPAGIASSVTGVSGATASVTITGTTAAAAGSYYFRVSINGAMSNVAILTILDKTVSVGAQDRILMAGMAAGDEPVNNGDGTLSYGWARFPVTATGISNGSYTAAVSGSMPQGMDGIYVDTPIAISGGSGTLEFQAFGPQPAGIYNGLRLTISGTQSGQAFSVQSEPFTLVISPAGFVPVYDIETLTPATANVLDHITLTGTVIPANATNKTISWSRVSGTSGLWQGNIYIPYTAGTLVVRATIANGIAAGVNYTKDFSIKVTVAPDNSPPAVMPPVIEASDITHNSLTLSWKQATDNATLPNDLKYYVYTKFWSSGTFTTVNGLPIGGGSLLNPGGTTYASSSIPATYTVNSLVPGFSYYFVVVAEDAAGNKTAYAPMYVTMLEDPGNGTTGSPFKVKTLDDLKRVGSDMAGPGGTWSPSARYRQYADIAITGYTWTPQELTSGRYNGDGYSITGLYLITQSTDAYIGLFKTLGSGGIIENVRLSGIYLYGEASYVGGIAGENRGGTIQNCHVMYRAGGSNLIRGTMYIGGITGDNKGTVTQCSSECEVIAEENYGGGIAGLNFNSSTISRSFSTGEIHAYGKYTGGVAGVNFGTIENCYVTGKIGQTKVFDSKSSIGGVAGLNMPPGTIRYCYVTGDVAGDEYTAGGITGDNNYGTIRNCVSLSKVISNAYTGTQIIGNFFLDGAISNCYARSDQGGISGIRFAKTVSAADYGSTVWWNTSGNWHNAAWDFGTVWQWGSSLPVLQGLSGVTQNPAVTP